MFHLCALILGGVNEFEMLRTFNCGVGGILIVKKEDELDILTSLSGSYATTIGRVTTRSEGKYLGFRCAKINTI